MEGLLGHEPDWSGADDEGPVHGQVPGQIDDMNAVRERFSETGRGGGQFLRPGQEHVCRHGDALGKGTGPVHAEDLTLGAQMRIAALAAYAVTARNDGVGDNPTPDECAVHAGSGGDHGAAEFMPHHQRRRPARAVVLERFQFAAADPTGSHLDDDLTRLGDWFRQVDQFELIEFGIEKCFHAKAGVERDAEREPTEEGGGMDQAEALISRRSARVAW